MATETMSLGNQVLHMTFLQVRSQHYFKANAVFFEDIFGFGPGAAEKLDGKWVRLGGATWFFAPSGYTVSQLSSLLDLVGELNVLPGAARGAHPTVGVAASRQTPSGLYSEAVYLRAKAPHYPVAIDLVTGGTRSHLSFFDWASQSLPSPAGAVPVQSIQGMP